MRKIFVSVLFSVFFFALFFSLNTKVALSSASDSCKVFSTTPDYKSWTPATKTEDVTNITIGPGTGIADGTPLFPLMKTGDHSSYFLSPSDKGVNAQEGKISFKPRNPGGADRLTSLGTQTILLSRSTSPRDDQIICSSTYTIKLRCTLTVENYQKSFGPGDAINVRGNFYFVDANGNESYYVNQNVDVRLFSNYQKNTQGQADLTTDDTGFFTGARSLDRVLNSGDVGKWYITASPTGLNNFNEQTCVQEIYVSLKSGEDLPEGMSLSGNQTDIIPLFYDESEKINPLPCANQVGNTCKAIKTAIGPFSTEPAGFIADIFRLLLGISGGIAVVLIIISGYKLMASQGNPEKVQGAREILTSAIVGLLFIIFSFVILQIIGVDILKIPGFG